MFGEDRGFPKRPYTGTCTNVFQVGAVVLNIMTRKPGKIARVPIAYGPMTLVKGKGDTHAQELESVNIYSDGLRRLVAECVLREPLNRPSTVNILARVRAGLAAASRNQALFPLFARIPVGDTSFVNTEWSPPLKSIEPAFVDIRSLGMILCTFLPPRDIWCAAPVICKYQSRVPKLIIMNRGGIIIKLRCFISKEYYILKVC